VRAARSIDLYVRPFCGSEGIDALTAHVKGISAVDREMSQRLGSIDAPASVVWGRRDRVLPLDTGRALAKQIPGATLDVIDDGYHFTPEETPRQVADAIGTLLRR
jgi:pimeloyl-ACP methyl ester carboxylesterase